ncbi:peptidyl-tRNA hydrolase [Ornithinimicrobium murale]|uniref:peptidyl-tRNA hydrolase n=1 Tax=Ornithinimicrobium murale TaxID=1050153 RepID=UPI0013B3B166|nr:peptidyl-tRNA hydrolase [Ornithinimicrobium murale]
MTVDDLDLVQPIVLLDAGTHEDACRAVALASVTAWLTHHEHPSWGPWLAGRFTKTVRRAKNEHALTRALDAGPVVVERVGEAAAAALVPVTYFEMDRYVRKLQVTGLELPRCGSEDVATEGGPTILVNTDLGMSTGKSAAQVAHGLFAWLLSLDEDARTDWLYGGRRFDLAEVAAAELATSPELSIHDAGLTEIAPGSATVKVLEPGRHTIEA